MWAIIASILQIAYLFFKNKFEQDSDEKKRKEALRAESDAAIQSRDVDRMADVLSKLRNQQ